MKQTLAMLFVTALLLFSLAGCGEKKDSNTANGPSTGTTDNGAAGVHSHHQNGTDREETDISPRREGCICCEHPAEETGSTTLEPPAKQAGRDRPLQRTQAARNAQAGWNRGVFRCFTPDRHRGWSFFAPSSENGGK